MFWRTGEVAETTVRNSPRRCSTPQRGRSPPLRCSEAAHYHDVPAPMPTCYGHVHGKPLLRLVLNCLGIVSLGFGPRRPGMELRQLVLEPWSVTGAEPGSGKVDPGSGKADPRGSGKADPRGSGIRESGSARIRDPGKRIREDPGSGKTDPGSGIRDQGIRDPGSGIREKIPWSVFGCTIPNTGGVSQTICERN